MCRLVILLILLPVVFARCGARALLVPVTAAESYDAFRTRLNRQIPALMQTHGVAGVARSR
jgi:hypothetical protein